ncbi:MAG: ABC transporter permease, partial [Planctomycetota bacterium]
MTSGGRPDSLPGRPPSGRREATLAILTISGVLVLGLVLGNYGEDADLVRIFAAVPEKTAWLLFWVLAASLAVVLAFGPRRGQLAAMGSTAFREVVRGGSLWVALCVGLLLAVGAPFLAAAGGTAGRVKMIVSVTLGAAGVLGTLLAVALPALTFSREMETRSIYVTASKPAPRWVIFGGKLLGVVAALTAAVAFLWAGGFVAANAVLIAESRRAAAAGEDPDHVWLTSYYARMDTRKPLAGGDERAGRREVFYRGQKREYSLDVSPEDCQGRWAVLRIYAAPANPRIRAAPALVRCAGVEHKVNVNRSHPVDLVVPAPPGGSGRLQVVLEPVLDLEGINRGLRTDPRGAVALARAGNGLALTMAKSLGTVLLQLIVVAAVTLTAASVLSFPVAAVTGVAAAITGHLSGLAVGILRGA